MRDPVVATSSRRFEGRASRTLLVWSLLHAAFWIGVPPRRLARYYADVL